MKAWVCTDHDSVWVGGASLILAENEEEARELFEAALRETHLQPDKGYTLIPVDITKSQAIVLRDGDY